MENLKFKPPSLEWTNYGLLRYWHREVVEFSTYGAREERKRYYFLVKIEKQLQKNRRRWQH